MFNARKAMVTRRVASEIVHHDYSKLEGDLQRKALGFVPSGEKGTTILDFIHIVALQIFMDGRNDGLPVMPAGERATRFHDAIRAHPAADQLTMLILENGARSVHPTETLDLTTGFISGNYLRRADTIDVRNVARRVARELEDRAHAFGDVSDE